MGCSRGGYDTNDIAGCAFINLVPSSTFLTLSRCNDSVERALQYRKFNLQALVNAAVNIVGNGAKSCANEPFIIC
jgi:hypothetical protein